MSVEAQPVTVGAEGEAPGDDRLHGITDLRRHTARGMLVNAAFDLSLVGLSAMRGLVVAALVTRSDYGVWGLLGLMMWTAIGLKSVFGAGDKYVQQSEENQEHAFQRAFTVEWIFAGAAAPFSAAVVIIFYLVNGNSDVLAPGLILLLLLPVTALQFPMVTFYRRMDYLQQRRLQAIDPVLGAVVTIVAAALGAGYWSFVIGLLSGAIAGAIVAVRACPYRLALRYDRGTLREYIHFSVPMLIAGLAVLALYQVIFLAGGPALGLAGLGTFTLVGNLMQFTDQADAIVTNTLYPAVCAVSDRLALLSEIFVKSNRLSLLWATPFGLGMALFGGDLVHFVLGNKWLPAVPLLRILGVVTVVHHLGYNWSAFIKARGITWPMAVAAVLGSTVMIAVAIPLMYSDGLVGLGWAFAIGEAVNLIVRGTFVVWFFGKFGTLIQLLRACLPAVIAGAVVLALRTGKVHEHTALGAIAMLALYVAVTIAGSLVLERALLHEALGYMLQKRRQVAASAAT